MTLIRTELACRWCDQVISPVNEMTIRLFLLHVGKQHGAELLDACCRSPDDDIPPPDPVEWDWWHAEER